MTPSATPTLDLNSRVGRAADLAPSALAQTGTDNDAEADVATRGHSLLHSRSSPLPLPSQSPRASQPKQPTHSQSPQASLASSSGALLRWAPEGSLLEGRINELEQATGLVRHLVAPPPCLATLDSFP